MKHAVAPRKRGRSVLELLEGVDALMATPTPSYTGGALGSSDATCGTEVKDEVPQNSIVKPEAHSESMSTSASIDAGSGAGSSTPLADTPLTDASESLGGAELDLLHRRDEERSDMCLFLSSTVGRLSTKAALKELVDFFVKSDSRTLLLALKHMGAQRQFFMNLCQARYSQREAKDLLLFIFALFPHSSGELFCAHFLVSFVLHIITVATTVAEQCATSPSSASSQSQEPVMGLFVTSPQPPTLATKPRHWSDRSPRKKATSVMTSNPPTLELTPTIVGMLPDGEAAELAVLGTAQVALRLLTRVALWQNRQDAVPPGVGRVPTLVVSLNGLGLLSRCMRCSCIDVIHDALHLLEVLTVSEGFTASDCDSSESLVELTQFLVSLLSDDAPAKPMVDLVTVLRVFTNITNISPAIFHGPLYSTDLQALANWCGTILLGGDAASGGDVVTFTLCTAINVIRNEVRAGCCAFSCSMLETNTQLLQRCASDMYALYCRGSTEDAVRSGYYALFLSALSLVHVSAEETLRMAVLTAIAQATRSTTLGRHTEGKPMIVVVVILQEFMLFQSSSGTLTREGTVGITEVLRAVMLANDITPYNSEEVR